MSKSLPFQAQSPATNILEIPDLARYFERVSAGKVQKLILLCCCLYLSRTTNLYKCADEAQHLLSGNIKEDSCYQFLLRFFRTGQGEFLLSGIFCLIVHLLWVQGEAILLMDRTNWKQGKLKMTNVLVLGLVYKGVFIPLVWEDLNRAGNSSHLDRLALVDRFLAWWGKTGFPRPTLYIVGDREFIGQHWLIGLERRQLHYVMRLKQNRTFELWQRYPKGKRKVRLSVIQRWLTRYEQPYAEVVIGDALIAHVVIKPLEQSTGPEGSYLYLITNISCPQQVQALYRIRWQIEVCFKHLKTNGFHLEDINMDQPHKIELMFGVLTLTYALAIREGVLAYDHMESSPPVKTYANGQQSLKKSVFRKGLTQLKRKIKDLSSMWRYLQILLHQIADQRKQRQTQLFPDEHTKPIVEKSIQFLY